MNQKLTKRQSNIPVYILLAITAIVITVMVVSEIKSKVNPTHNESGVYVDAIGNLDSFISLVRENNAIIAADFKKETGMIYITITDDGLPKTEMAIFYGRLARVSKAYLVKGVKVVDRSGKELGKVFL